MTVLHYGGSLGVLWLLRLGLARESLVEILVQCCGRASDTTVLPMKFIGFAIASCAAFATGRWNGEQQ
jgi:hypothetical protein